MKRLFSTVSMALAVLLALTACSSTGDIIAENAAASSPAVSTLDHATVTFSVQEPPASSAGPEDAAASAPESNTEPDDAGAGSLGDCYVEITGAEAVSGGDGKPAVRFYYDFTNRSDAPASALFSLSAAAYQDGYELVSAYTLDSVPEEGNSLLNVRPGLTLRCVAEYTYQPEGGALQFILSDFGDGDTVSMAFDPQDLPGRPAALEIHPITEPDWMEGLAPEGVYENDYYVKISDYETGENYAGEPMLRIYYAFTNNAAEPASFLTTVTEQVMQDGIELPITFSLDGVPEDDSYASDAAPGETVTVARCYLLRTDSPVTVQLKQLWTGEPDTIGALLPVA